MEQVDDRTGELDRAIGAQVRALRSARGLTLEALADKAGVSRAMLSRIERGESNPTAQLLGRVCAGLDVTLSALFAETERAASPLSRRADQSVWRDPGSGYVRRVVTPPNCGSAADIVDVEFPPGASVTMESSRNPAMDQQIVLLSGRMDITAGDTTHRLEAGDGLYTPLGQPVSFHNPGTKAAHYLVVVAPGGPRY
ncbi:helix-turn-helix domain-containing protein [Undibacter mobilis]|uniref:XRE family transcriptional regulator n=1 Tax=Undibacter mobilis TaxID=2292256 RepID=A0A371BA23_9BRAD|nr:helix-turn-helix domain-containing protein [Undibacter mobilis]RDV04430.1 XRE family transcriptional regulator [Undibacter mobilis]